MARCLSPPDYCLHVAPVIQTNWGGTERGGNDFLRRRKASNSQFSRASADRLPNGASLNSLCASREIVGVHFVRQKSFETHYEACKLGLIRVVGPVPSGNQSGSRDASLAILPPRRLVQYPEKGRFAVAAEGVKLFPRNTNLLEHRIDGAVTFHDLVLDPHSFDG